MILGISGVASSGKDSLAKFLADNHGFVVVSLADPIKRICRDVFDFTDEQLWGPSVRRNEPDYRYPRRKVMEMTEYLTPRHALQQIGTDMGRSCYQNVWVEYTLRIAKSLLVDPEDGSVPHYSAKSGLTYQPLGPYEMPKGVVIPDARFRNEIDGIRAAGGKVIRIRRPGAGLSGEAARHASEAEQAGIPDEVFDLVVENNGTLDDLRTRATGLLAELR